jgi:hypothetical protein
MTVTTIAFARALGSPLAPTQERKKPPCQSELAPIIERGRLLAGYDQAAWHASDAVPKLNPTEGTVERDLALKTKKGWIVAFFQVEADGNLKFLVTSKEFAKAK